MREDEPPSSPKKQQILNKQKLKNYFDSKTSTSRKPKKPSKFENMPESRKQQMRKMIKDLREGQENDQSMAQPEVYVLSGRLSHEKKQKVQVKQPKKPQKVVQIHSQPQDLLKEQSLSRNDNVFLLKKHEKSQQTLQNEYSQKKAQKKQKIHEKQKRLVVQQGAYNQENLEKVQVKQPEEHFEVVVQHSQPQAQLNVQIFAEKTDGFYLKEHEKSDQTLKNSFQQAKPHKQLRTHENQKPFNSYQAAQNVESLKQKQVKQLAQPSKLLFQSQIPYLLSKKQSFYKKYQPIFQQQQQRLGLVAKRNHKYKENLQISQEQEYFGSQQSIRKKQNLQKIASQPHNFNNLSNFQILKIILQQELEKNNHILEEFIFDISNLHHSQKKIKNNQLARLLQKIFIKKMTELTSQVIEQLKKLTDQLCKSLLVSLSEQVQEEYMFLANQYNQKYQKSKKLNKIPKNLNKFMEFMKKYPMNPQMVIKLDLLSYFFINNINYQIKYCRLPTDVVIPYIISKILMIDIEEIQKLRDTIEDKWNYVSMDHYEHFKGLIIITTLVALRQKVQNNQGRKIDSNKQRMPLLSKFTRVQQDFTFKFSQIAFESEGMLIKTYCTSKRLQIMQISKTIVHTNSQRHKKQLIIHTKSKYMVSINQLINLIHKVEHQHELFMEQYKEQLRLQEGIKEFPWYFYSPKCEVLKNSLRKLSKCSVTSKQLYDTDNYFANVLSKMMVQRTKELIEFTSASIKWHKKHNRRIFIFVSRFDYSYNRLQNLEEKVDLVGTLIIGTTRSKIVFTSFIKRDAPLTDAEYAQQLKNIFHQRLKVGVNFGILLYQFAIRSQFDSKEYAALRKYFWNRHQAIVMAASLPKQFYIHFILDLHISKWALSKSKDLVKNTFFDDIRKKINQTARRMTKILKALSSLQHIEYIEI